MIAPFQDPQVSRALKQVAELYTRGIQEKGPTSPAVGWPDLAGHEIRFAKLVGVIDEVQPFTVNDLGCGYGSLFTYLTKQYGPRIERFYGYDISSPMIDAAREMIKDERCEFALGSEISRPATYSFASGIFNVRFEATEDAWRSHVERTIRGLAANSKKGFAFNALSTYVDWRRDHLYYADPKTWFDFCKHEISSSVSLLHDYPLFEWTMLVRTDDKNDPRRRGPR